MPHYYQALPIYAQQQISALARQGRWIIVDHIEEQSVPPHHIVDEGQHAAEYDLYFAEYVL